MPRDPPRRGVFVWGMTDHPSDPRIAEHIEWIAARGAPDTEQLVAAMLRHCWPDASGGRSEPEARDWVRRWGPHRADALIPECSCAEGRCRICN